MRDWQRLLLSQAAPDDALKTAFPERYQPYLQWLLEQEEIPQSYRHHLFLDAEDLASAKVAISDALGISLGQFIRLLRINRLLRARKVERVNWSFGQIETPLGVMLAVFSENGLSLLEFFDRKMLPSELAMLWASAPNNGVTRASSTQLQPLQQQLTDYFSGKRQQFDLPLDTAGTPFQKTVWEMLRNIPYGETRSYKTQAECLGKPNAVRAIANANGQNKVSIIIPCHRVIGADGRLTGYGGGLPRKRYLLDLEQQHKRTS